MTKSVEFSYDFIFISNSRQLVPCSFIPCSNVFLAVEKHKHHFTLGIVCSVSLSVCADVTVFIAVKNSSIYFVLTVVETEKERTNEVPLFLACRNLLSSASQKRKKKKKKPAFALSSGGVLLFLLLLFMLKIMVMIKMNHGVLYFCMKVKKVSSFPMFSKCAFCYGKLFF